MKKRIFSLALALCLLLSVAPVQAFAEGAHCTCEAACTAENRSSTCPVCRDADNAPEVCAYSPPVTYTVTYKDAEGSNSFLPQTDVVNAGAATPAFKGTLSREGFLFAGWEPAVAGTVTKDVTYTAKWAVARTITYTSGTDHPLFTDDVHLAKDGDPTPAFSRDVNSFTGWKITGWNPVVAATVNGDATYTAQWEPTTEKKPPVSQENVESVLEEHNVQIAVFDDPSVFFTEAASSALDSWEVKGNDADGYTLEVTLSFNDTLEGNYKNKINEHYTPTGEALKTDNWRFYPIDGYPKSKKVVFTFVEGDWIAKEDSATLATFHMNQYFTVTYTDGVDGVELFKDQTSSVVKDAATPAFGGTPTRQGYGFQGWDKDVADKVTADVTYAAQWKANQYTVKFAPNGGTGTMADQTLTYDKAEKLTQNAFTRKGYKFTGWLDENGVTFFKDEKEVKNLLESGTITLYAQWLPDQYGISFDANGGTGIMGEMSMTYGVPKKLTKNILTRTGYQFDSWNTQRDGGGESYDDEEEVSDLTEEDGSSVTLYAQWSPILYCISFNANGGTGVMADQNMTYDRSLALRANTFTRSGYRFAGWGAKANGGVVYADRQEVKNLTKEPEATVTLYAQWVKEVGKLNFTLKGYGYKEKIKDIKVTGAATNEGVNHGGSAWNEYGGYYGICGEYQSLQAIWNSTPSSGTFREEKAYYLYITFFVEEGYTAEGLTKNDVFLDGVPAVKLLRKEGEVATHNDDGLAQGPQLTAVFALKNIYLIQASAGKNGKIDPEGTVAVFEGDDTTFTITPDKGYARSKLTVDGERVSTTKKTYTFNNVTKSHTIKATFAKDNGNAKTGDDSAVKIAFHALTISAGALAAVLLIRWKRRNKK